MRNAVEGNPSSGDLLKIAPGVGAFSAENDLEGLLVCCFHEVVGRHLSASCLMNAGHCGWARYPLLLLVAMQRLAAHTNFCSERRIGNAFSIKPVAELHDGRYVTVLVTRQEFTSPLWTVAASPFR